MSDRPRRPGNRGRVSIRDRAGRYMRRLPYLGLYEIAILMLPGATEEDVTKQARRLAAWRAQRNGAMPEPDFHLACGPVWSRSRVERWLRQRQGGPRRTPAEEAAGALRRELLAMQERAERLSRVLAYLELRAMRERARQTRSPPPDLDTATGQLDT